MINRRFRTWFIALMLLAFTGQTVSALAMPCPAMSSMMVAMNHDMTAMDEDMPSMDHYMSNHEMPMTHAMLSHADKGSVMKDCCKLPGHCASGSCSTAGFAHSVDFALTLSSATVGDNYLSVIPAALVSSLFRPPIFR